MQAMDRALLGGTPREARRLPAFEARSPTPSRSRARAVRDRRERLPVPARSGARVRATGSPTAGTPHEVYRSTRRATGPSTPMRTSGRSGRSWTSSSGRCRACGRCTLRRSPGRASRRRPCGTRRCSRRARSCRGRRTPRRCSGTCSWIAHHDRVEPLVDVSARPRAALGVLRHLEPAHRHAARVRRLARAVQDARLQERLDALGHGGHVRALATT